MGLDKARAGGPPGLAVGAGKGLWLRVQRLAAWRGEWRHSWGS